jgi:hypothetical protein
MRIWAWRADAEEDVAHRCRVGGAGRCRAGPAGTIDHVVNDTGAPVEPGPNGSTTSYVGSYP